MGWSCTAAASETAGRISNWCRATTGSSNVFVSIAERSDGERFFFEEGDEAPDGAIVGEVFREVGGNRAVPAGTYRIEPNGDFSSGPNEMAAAARGFPCGMPVIIGGRSGRVVGIVPRTEPVKLMVRFGKSNKTSIISSEEVLDA
jgi:hypothetical protein